MDKLLDLTRDFDAAKAAFEAYLDEYDRADDKIHLKIVHTYGVVDAAEDIARRMGLGEEDVQLAKVIGLLHDIGRFEQIRKYNTFMDKDSVNHAEYGVKVLFEDGLIRKFIIEDKYDNIIKKAILNHNKGYLDIDKNLNDKELLHTKIIRDADKLDIFKVLNIENMNVLYGNDVENQSINKEVYREFFEDKYINYKNINSGLDLAIAHFAYVYDFNYKFTLSKIKEEQVLLNLYNRFNEINNESKEKLNKVYIHANNYLNKELEEAI